MFTCKYCVFPEQLYQPRATDIFFRTEVDKILCRALILFEKSLPIALVDLNLALSCLGLLNSGIIEMGHQVLQITGELSMAVQDRERKYDQNQNSTQ